MRFLNSGQKLFWALLGIWLVVNLLQAGLTELDPDEAYYWMYSHALDWGYFDHPPAVALLIRLGAAFVPGTLGIRIGFALLQLGCFYFVWLLAGRPSQKKEVLTFVGLLAAMPLLEVYGFIATPDGPLLFFTALFFWLYQRFLDRKGGWVEALLLGTGMAALLYSKYHGVLLIFFVLLSNLKLLRRPGFYLASIFGFLLFLPHLFWQYAHGFPSFLYHLKGRDDAYELKYTITYVLNQMVIFSPLLFPLLVQALRQRPVEGALGRAYYFVIYGFWAFFFYASFKGHVEPQWTAILSIPFVLLLYRQSQISERFGRMVRIFSAITIFLILLARLELAFNWAGTKTEFNRRQWVYELQALAEGKPALFQNSYRDASKYEFYAHQPAYTYTDVDYRHNQFDIWDWEKALHNQTVLIGGRLSWPCERCREVDLTRKGFKIQMVDSLQIAQKVGIELRNGIGSPWRPGERVSLPVLLSNPYPHHIRFGAGTLPLHLSAVFYQDAVARSTPPAQFLKASTLLLAGDSLAVELQFTVPDSLAGPYQFGLGVCWGDLPPLLNSKLVEVEVAGK